MSYWFEIKNNDQLLSPALLFYPDHIRNNIQKMITIAGSPDRLRPHIKTYKCKEIIAMQMKAGITRFKCATLSEAQMLGECNAADVLVAYPLTGPNQRKFLKLSSRYPQTTFSVLIDHEQQVNQWKRHLNGPVDVYIDLDVGMHRTGIKIDKLESLLQAIEGTALTLQGFHAYDGHIKDKNITQRKEHVKRSFEDIEQFMDGYDGPKTFITGGSISFPIHAEYQQRTLSPGTTLLWDQGYSENFADLNFDHAALLFTRVISKPGRDLLCFDLGHKAVASEMKPNPPVVFPQLPEAKITGQSEEHLVLKTKRASTWNIGDELYGIPWHICPTVALHAKAGIVKKGTVQDFWDIASRNRFYFLNK